MQTEGAMAWEWPEGQTNPGMDGGTSAGSWARFGGRLATADDTLTVSVDGGPPQDVTLGDDLSFDFDGPILDNGEHTIEVVNVDDQGNEHTTSWTVDVDETPEDRNNDRRLKNEWGAGGQREFLDSGARRNQGPLTGGGGGGAGQLVTAGAGGAAALTGTAEKGNATPQVEKGNAN